VTIPDIGHCAGSGAQPITATTSEAAGEAGSGVCPACSGRFELREDGSLSLHESAEIDEREELSPDG